MFNRLQAIRAALFGISFNFFCLLLGLLAGLIIHDYASYVSEITVIVCIGLTLLTLCVTWATLKPYVIYGGLHSIVWFVAIAVAVVFNSLLPLAIGLFVCVFLFVKLDQIMLFLHNLNRPRIIFGNAMPKQPRYAPDTSLDNSSYYQQGYQPQKSSGHPYQEDQQTLFYPQSSDFKDSPQAQYPEMMQ